MRELPSKTTPASVESPSKPAAPPAATDAPGAANDEVIVASQDVLFGDVPSSRCDACGVPIAEADEAEGYGIPGRGVYLWARGEDAHLESVPLCASCASAIGMTALARWEIEEEEG
jgi:hypothetical protein